MNLETSIDPRLWRSVQSAYESRNYTAAILDAVYFVGDLIREKAGLQSDGVALIGQAFGGKAPALKVNKLQTESERNIQAGVEQLLKGIYQAIRNPRSHEKVTDTSENALAIILFLNYLIALIDKTKTIFSRTDFLKRVFDKNFVAQERYAKLLVEEIPAKQRLEIMIDVFRAKRTGDGTKLRFFVQALYAELSDDERAELHIVISDELKSTEEDEDFRLVLQLFPPALLERLPEATRLRLENRLLLSISTGDFDQRTGKCRKGALGTWLNGWTDRMLLKEELEQTIRSKFQSADTDEHAYVAEYFLSTMLMLTKNPTPRLITSLKRALKSGSVPTKELVENLVTFFDNAEIGTALSAEITNFTPRKSASDAFEDDEIPF